MNNFARILMFSAAIVVVGVVALASPTPALADDSLPPAEAPAVEGTESTEAGGTEAAPSEAAVTPALDDGEDSAVNEAGAAVPLATEEAATVPAGGDPVWCPSGVAPNNTASNGCSASYTTLEELINDFNDDTIAQPTTNGAIWIMGYVASGSAADGSLSAIVLDGDDPELTTGSNSWRDFALTFRGGWNGISGSTGVNTGDPSEFNVSLTVMNWNASITLSDILFTGIDTTGQALTIETSRNITLTRVVVGPNPDGGGGGAKGAKLDNTDGTSGTGNVTITASRFIENFAGDGLNIDSRGTITLNGVTASDNFGSGADLYNFDAPIAKSVTLTGVNVFNNNGPFGLYVISNGAVSATQLIANGNTGTGASLGNALSSSSGITISSFGEFSDNGASGLDISARGAVTTRNLTAVNNGTAATHNGVRIQNFTALPVTLNGMNQFHSNGDNGLRVESLGPIRVHNVNASDNAWGVDLRNLFSLSPQGITITGYLTAVGNSEIGLWVQSDGTVTAANLTTSDNGQEGTLIVNYTAPVTSNRPITITGFNVFSNNGQEGLDIHTAGTVTLYNVTALGNGYGLCPNDPDPPVPCSGVYIYSADDATLQRSVILAGTNVFNHNALSGLELYTYGAVSLRNITANDNGSGVADITPPQCDTGCGVYIINSGGALAKPVTISGANSFNQNVDDGLRVYTNGAIKVYNASASDNGLMGMYLYNNNSSGTPPQPQSPISIYGFGVFDRNGLDGLHIYSSGAITTYNLTATSNVGDGVSNSVNDGDGVYIYTKGLTSPQPVTLNGYNTMQRNGATGAGSGLVVWADGSIRVYYLNASFNQLRGARLDNLYNWDDGSPFATFGSVTVSGFGNFTGNLNGDGLYVNSHGSVSLSRPTAHMNGFDAGDHGIEILADGNVTLTCALVYGNEDTGLLVDGGLNATANVLTLKGLVAFGNLLAQEDLSYVSIVRTVCP